MTQYVFGSGQLFGIDSNGAPVRFGALQDVSIDFSGDMKQLHGQLQFPLAIGRGKSKIDIKASYGQLDVNSYNALYFGQTAGVTSGKVSQALNEAATIPAPSGPYTVTVANSATFELDLGVTVVSTGQPLRQVPSAATPATGEYKVTAGVYTFNAAQASIPVLFNYLYTTSGSGHRLDITNQLMGLIPSFGLVLSETFDSKTMVARFYKCVSEKLSLPFKQDDFKVDDLSIQALQLDTAAIGYISVSE